MSEPGALPGRLERADRFGVSGWTTRATSLEVFADGRLAGVAEAERLRPDLPPGAAAFEAWFSPPLPPDSRAAIALRHADGRPLAGTPVTLAGPTPPDTTAPAAPPPDSRPLAIVIDPDRPDRNRDAGSAALISHVAALERLGWRVVFSRLAEGGAALARHGAEARLVWLHRLPSALALAAAARSACPSARIVFALADLASLREARRADIQGGTHPRGLQAAEDAAFALCDWLVTHSPVEAELLARRAPDARIALVPWHVRLVQDPEAPFAARRGIGFVGNFGHAPNLDAAVLLARGVMPQVWRVVATPCVIAGHGAPADIRALASDRVKILDSVPDIYAAFWRRLRVSAAPLRFGAGIKGKVLDSLAAGVPCVCSPIAAEGLDLPPELVAPDVPGMAARLRLLHEDEAANAAAARAGQALVARGNSEAAVDRALRPVLRGLV